MKTLICQCGRTIQVRGGIVGYVKRFPQIIYLCECGMAYRPEILGCMVFNKAYQEDNANPRAMTATEYEAYKTEELKAAAELKIRSEDAIVEIMAEEILGWGV